MSIPLSLYVGFGTSLVEKDEVSPLVVCHVWENLKDKGVESKSALGQGLVREVLGPTACEK